MRSTWVAELHWQGWMLPAGIAAMVLGLVLVYTAVVPTSRTHLALGSDAGPVVWLRPTDVARMCSAHAGTVAGVHSVHTTWTGGARRCTSYRPATWRTHR